MEKSNLHSRIPLKSHTTKRGYTYAYYSSPAGPNRPYVLLQHGFPDSADEWEDLIINYLLPRQVGVIAPDLLGYGGTSKPTDPAEYKLGLMAADLVEILDAEGVTKVISLGHDWGSRMAQLLYNLHPDRVSGLVMVNVPYQGANRAPFDLDAILAQPDHGALPWYWKLFTAEDGARLLQDKAQTFFKVMHAPQSWPQTICTKGGTRKVLETEGEGFDLQTRPYATADLEKAFVNRMKRDGFEGPVCWYKSHVLGLQINEPNPDNAVVNVPTLFLGYSDEALNASVAIQGAQAAGFLPQLTNITLKGAHWGLLDDPKAFGEAVSKWLDDNYR